MRSVEDSDLTRRAAIRNAALELIAAKGADAATVREIADKAGVSAPLVVHHYGSKANLVEAVNDYVAGMFDAMLGDLAANETEAPSASLDAGAWTAVFAEHVPPDSPLPAYLRRLLLERDPVARRLFARWMDTTAGFYESLVDVGVARPAADPAIRAAFLLVNDLALLLLRELITDAVGVDPLSPQGAQRWAAEAMDVYLNGAFITDAEEAP
jgi:AcrR family transcriptional regulator